MKKLQFIISLALAAFNLQANAENCWIDVTDKYITNPSFDNSSNSGWTIEASASSTSCSYGAQEFWNGTWNIYQTVSLPNGTYRISVQAYHRRTNNSASEVTNYSYYTVPSNLYANSTSTPIVNIFSEHLTSSYSSCYSYNGQYFPNNMEAGEYCFEQGMYNNELEFTVTNGSVTFGIQNTSNVTSNWCMMDNWKLEQYTTLVEATGVTLDAQTLDIELGDTHQLTATILPSNASYDKVTWSSSNPDVATVDENGLVTSLTRGTTTITATTVDGTNLTASCDVTVTYNAATAEQLVINEVMASNVDMFVDPSWNYGGWIELYNPTNTNASIGNYYISNDASNLKKHHLPTDIGSVPAGGFKTLWFGHADTRKDISEGWENTQVGFNLDPEGGTIYISDDLGNILVTHTYPASVMRTSYARTTDGGNIWNYTSTPTPEATNAGSTFATEQLAAPVVDENGQLFTGSLTVKVDIPVGTTLRYTTDGTTPTLSNGATSNTGLFTVSSASTVYRFRLFEDGYLPSNVVTRSYIYKDKDYYLPVVSIVTDQKNLYDDEIGVYVTGTNGKTANQDATKRNFNMDWDRPVSFEYIDENTDGGYFCQEVDFAINGGWSRKYEPRSFKVKSSKVYDLQNTLDYPFFSEKPYDKHKTLLFRNGGNDDYNKGRIKDAALQQVARESGFPLNLQSYQPVHVFIDGTYLGMLNMREPSNKNYAYSNYGIDTDNVDAFEMSVDSGYVQKDGTREAFEQWYSLAKTAGDELSYQQICKLVDIDDYTNYMAFKFFLNDWDWPHNNVKAFRGRDDNKFHFMVYDLDNCVTSSGNNIFTDFAGKQTHTFYSRPEYNWTSITAEVELVTIFLNMLQNETFKKKFIDTYCIVGGTVFGYEDEITSTINSMVSNVTTALTWEGNQNYLTSQASTVLSAITGSYRSTMTSVLKNYSTFGLSSKETQAVTISSNVDGASLCINGINLPKARFNGYLFAPITLSATAPAGYRFAGWDNGGSSSTTTTSETIFPESTSWKYYQGGSLDNTEWNATSYATTSWSDGTAPFGYGNSGKYMATNAATTLSKTDASSNRIPTYYFRKTFTLDQTPTESDTYTLSYSVDDGMVVYVNGTYVDLYHMWEGATYDQTCQSTGNNWYEGDTPYSGTIDIPYSLLQKGDNVIAVEVHNCNDTSSDIWWSGSLTATHTTTSGDATYASTSSEYTLPTSGTQTIKAVFTPLTRAELMADNITPIRINEVSATADIYASEHFKRADWIELYNTTTEDIDLTGMYLSDNAKKPQKYQLPSGSIPAHGYKIVWADQLEPVSQLHASFKLNNADGATVSIQAEDGTWADCMEYLAQEDGETYGRFPDGTSTCYMLNAPTIEKQNRFDIYTTTSTLTDDDNITILLSLEKGWNWISHNLAESVDKSRLTGYASCIRSQKNEVVNDATLGWQGNLTTLEATLGYKVNMNDTVTICLHGSLYDVDNEVTLNQGWNWIGVPLQNATTIEAALQNYSPTEGDMIVGLEGFTTYEEGSWSGTLTTLTPGQAYLVKAGQAQAFCWTSLAANKVRRKRYAAPLINEMSASSPWIFDAHAYPNVMNVIATISDNSELYTINSPIGVFVEDECRGLAQVVNGLLYITAHGNAGERISFRMLNEDNEVLTADQNLQFVAQSLIGKRSEPYILSFGKTDKIEALTPTGRVVSITYYSLNGQRLTCPQGVCIQKVTYDNGMTQTTKITK